MYFSLDATTGYRKLIDVESLPLGVCSQEGHRSIRRRGDPKRAGLQMVGPVFGSREIIKHLRRNVIVSEALSRR